MLVSATETTARLFWQDEDDNTTSSESQVVRQDCPGLEHTILEIFSGACW